MKLLITDENPKKSYHSITFSPILRDAIPFLHLQVDIDIYYMPYEFEF